MHGARMEHWHQCRGTPLSSELWWPIGLNEMGDFWQKIWNLLCLFKSQSHPALIPVKFWPCPCRQQMLSQGRRLCFCSPPRASSSYTRLLLANPHISSCCRRHTRAGIEAVGGSFPLTQELPCQSGKGNVRLALTAQSDLHEEHDQKDMLSGRIGINLI